MKTDELIDMLATNPELVKGGQLRNTLVMALVVAVVAALCLMLVSLGVPANALGGEHFGFKVIALAFTLGLAAVGAMCLFRSARPGQSARKPLLLIGLLFLTMVSAGIVALVVLNPAAWIAVMIGGAWAACLICIPFFAMIPFATLIWAVRKGAPTNLTRTGAIAGLVAGALGAAAVTFHFPGASLPFIALWYGGPIALCALVGAILGPRLLRW